MKICSSWKSCEIMATIPIADDEEEDMLIEVLYSMSEPQRDIGESGVQVAIENVILPEAYKQNLYAAEYLTDNESWIQDRVCDLEISNIY